MSTMLERLGRFEFPAVAVLVVGALVAWIASARGIVDPLLIAATLIALVPAFVHGLGQVVRREHGVDVIAVLAMVGALAFGEYVAGAVIAIMLTGGEALEEHAAGRARRELTALLGRTPRTAHRRVDGDVLEDIDIGRVAVGDVLVVKGGEVIPTDGVLRSPTAILDVAALTGESVPAELALGGTVVSGTVNAGSAFEMLATTSVADSSYSGIVRLVEQAATEKAPFVRLADRYATGFVWLTLAMATLAYIVSGDPVRSLAVLVVATPCPMIIAAPAAIVGGISRAARQGIIVKGGAAIEALAGVTVVLLDKTGTITSGRPTVSHVHVLDDLEDDELLALAGSLEQVSLHPFAPAIVGHASVRGLPLRMPTDVEEVLGSGVSGRVGDRVVRVGRLAFAADGGSVPSLRRIQRRASMEGESLVHVAVDGRLAGVITLHDPVRPDAPAALRSLRRAGIGTVMMVTGDRTEIAEIVAESMGIDRVLAERVPAEKVDAVREAQTIGSTLMVGDGINDAPALAVADVGIAMGARGASAASEAADVVVTADRLSSVAEAMRIATRTRRIAWQSVVVGMGLSALGMVAATAGYLTPVAGAVLQEVIDLAVIGNALRALRPGRRGLARGPRPIPPARIMTEHVAVRDSLTRLGRVADRLEDDRTRPAALIELAGLRDYLVDELLAHELEEEREVYPLVAAAAGREDPTGSLVRSHREITRRIRMLARLIDDVGVSGVDRDDVLELQRSLWGLHAVLSLHVALEDEAFGLLGAPSAAEVTQ